MAVKFMCSRSVVALLKARLDMVFVPVRGGHLCNYDIMSNYQIPEHIRNGLNMANTTVVDNALYFYHEAIQISYKDLLADVRKMDPHLTEDVAIKYLQSVVNAVAPCDASLEVLVPVQRDNGKFEMVSGFRSQHSHTRVPCMGGFRFCKDLDADEVRGMATLWTFKHACMHIPFSGAFGGLKLPPSQYSSRELHATVTGYCVELAKRGFLSPATDVHEPDTNMGLQVMGWVADAFQQTVGHGRVGSCAAAVGKPLHRGGLHDYQRAGGMAAYYGVDHFLADNSLMVSLGIKPGWCAKTYILQGLGKVGRYLTEYFNAAGAKCIGVMERDASVYHPQGIDTQQLAAYKDKKKTIKGYEAANPYEGNMLEHQCDLLVLAATHKAINYVNAQNVNARIVVEAANQAMSPSAHKILMGRNILVIPDLYTATGASIAGYMEYVKNVNHVGWGYIGGEEVMAGGGGGAASTALDINRSAPMKITLTQTASEQDVVRGVIEKTMNKVAEEILKTSQDYRLGIDLRAAAYVNAVKRIFQTYHDMKRFH